MRIIIENTVCLNTGDAAILLAIRKIVKTAWTGDVKFHVFDSQPDVAGKLYADPQFADMDFNRLVSEDVLKADWGGGGFVQKLKPVYNEIMLGLLSALNTTNLLRFAPLSNAQRQSLKKYQNADLVITTGGTYLVENYNLARRINQFRFDALFSKTPVFFTQSMGPFAKSENRKGLKPALDNSPLILLRDQRSKNQIMDLVDDPGKCHVVADSVFALAEIDRIKTILRTKKVAAPSGKVAVSVRDWNYVKGRGDGIARYAAAVAAMVDALVKDHGKHVTFVSTCQGVPEYAHDDSAMANRILQQLDADVAKQVTVDTAFRRPDQLMEFVDQFEFVISTRMHMMIMSLCKGIPVLPIAYEFKTEELAARLGISDVLLNIDTVDKSIAREKLDAFVSKLTHYRSLSLENVLKEHESAMSAATLLEKYVMIQPSS